MIRNLLPSLDLWDTTVIVQTVADANDSDDNGYPIEVVTDDNDVPAFVSGPTNADAVAGLPRYSIVVLLPLTVAVDYSSRIVVESGQYAGTYDVQEVRTTAIHHRILCRTRPS